MDPTQAVNAALAPWAQWGIVGSVVIALSLTVVFLGMWVKSLVSKTIERLETEITQKEQAYERLVDSTRKRTKDDANG
jgi:hypothetical protein